MRAKGFTDEQVIAAAIELDREGKNINGTSLRKVIGTGRPNTLIDTYNQLKDQDRIKLLPKEVRASFTATNEIELPSSVAEKMSLLLAQVEELVQECNNEAHNAADKRLTAAQEDANNAKKQASITIEAAIKDQEQAYEEVEDLKDELDIQKQKFDELNEKFIKIEQELKFSQNQYQNENKLANKQAQKLSEQDKEIKDLESQLKSIELGNSKLQGTLEQVQVERDESRKELELNKATLATKLDELSESKSEATAAKAERDVVNKNIIELSEVIKVKETEYKSLSDKHTQGLIETESLNHQLQSVLKELNDMKAVLKDKPLENNDK